MELAVDAVHGVGTRQNQDLLKLLRRNPLQHQGPELVAVFLWGERLISQSVVDNSNSNTWRRVGNATTERLLSLCPAPATQKDASTAIPAHAHTMATSERCCTTTSRSVSLW